MSPVTALRSPGASDSPQGSMAEARPRRAGSGTFAARRMKSFLSAGVPNLTGY